MPLQQVLDDWPPSHGEGYGVSYDKVYAFDAISVPSFLHQPLGLRYIFRCWRAVAGLVLHHLPALRKEGVIAHDPPLWVHSGEFTDGIKQSLLVQNEIDSPAYPGVVERFLGGR